MALSREGETHWARLKTAVDLPLRLGAWYRVVAPVTALEVVVSIQGTRVSVPRPYVELRATPPAEWTVVRNAKVRPDRTPQMLREGYLVCRLLLEKKKVLSLRRGSLAAPCSL